MKIKPQQAVST